MPDAAVMTLPPQQPDQVADSAWYVQTAGQVWGPYSSARIARFAAEGRVTPQSLLAVQAQGPFHPASRWRSLTMLFQAPDVHAPGFEAAASYRHRPAPVQGAAPDPTAPTAPTAPAGPTMRTAVAASVTRAASAAGQGPLPASSASTPSRPLLIWADLASLDAEQFEALLARCGAAVAIRAAVWLVQARCDAATLRNALTRYLTGADALIIVHAPLDQAAWFNLDSSAERRLRQVWGGG